MPAWLLKVFHFIGLTNLTDEQVRRYAVLKQNRRLNVTFIRVPILSISTAKGIALCNGPSLATTGHHG